VLQSDRSPSSAAKTAILAGVIVIALLGGIALDRLWLRSGASAPTVPSETESASDTLKLDAARIRDAGIGLLRVAPGDLTSQIIAQATVAATPEGTAVIGARADGTVTEIRKRLGDRVVKGEVLGAIQSREAAKLAEDRGKSQARVVRAQQAFDRQKHLLAANATSRQDYDAAEAEWRIATAELARANAASAASGVASDGGSLNIISPVSGRITAAPAVLGAYVVAGTDLFRVADPTKLEVQAALPSIDAQRIAVGDTGIIDLPRGPIAATVRAITPDINLQSRAATAVLVPRSAGALQPGQLVSVRIAVAHGHSDQATVLIPSMAIQKMDGGDAVFVRSPEGFRVRPVITGAESGGMTEVRSGLKPGEEIATANSFLLKAELEKGSAGDDE